MNICANGQLVHIHIPLRNVHNFISYENKKLAHLIGQMFKINCAR